MAQSSSAASFNKSPPAHYHDHNPTSLASSSIFSSSTTTASNEEHHVTLFAVIAIIGKVQETLLVEDEQEADETEEYEDNFNNDYTLVQDEERRECNMDNLNILPRANPSPSAGNDSTSTTRCTTIGNNEDEQHDAMLLPSSFADSEAANKGATNG